MKKLIAKIRSTSPVENLVEILGKDLGKPLYKLISKAEEADETVKHLQNEIKRLKILMGKYSDYHSLTMDGMQPEEASRECNL